MQLYTLDPVCRELNVGINQKLNELNFVSVYPNPIENWIIIDNSKSSEGGGFSIEDVSGRQLLKGELGLQTKTKIDCSQILEGVYFVRIKGKEQEIVKKLIKH